MINEGRPIFCKCPADNRGKFISRYQFKMLGSVTPEGFFEIKRGISKDSLPTALKRKLKTVIVASDFMVVCPDCGYSQTIHIDEVVKEYDFA